ncbi:type I-E CRISPR-associated protein Cas7/Cse4/CasC [Streptomyces sp. ISID311]|uniref:type I-E CRISPR-associated protein Cas7/Cse4/CasC n=1 Tax=Streptomyces sp. ISID311 TaxID=2601673 RepID=UPI0011BD3923|nr:type I-E CRISPR-associated protein Cas7/Cse4/CasC [Streptomyces sp. ISID311]TXC99774.1 type I-E CRISPR-associated protein Cas7/Cse4/CasC [Streptomyces sp. ISID311]
MTRGSRFLDLHILQPVTASNLNRGESGHPKTIKLGDAERAMISSAAWKRPVRLEMEEELGESAARTRMVPPVLADALRQHGWPDDLADFTAAQIAQSAKTGGLKTNPQQGHRTQAMLYLPVDVTSRLLEICAGHRRELEQALVDQNTTGKQAPPVLPTKQIATELTRRTTTINLFGRMLAEIPTGHVDGAVQVAPAFTVHEARLQPDFFTAVEDWPRPNEAGSAHLETAFLTAGVFYRFTTVNVTALITNLDGDTAAAQKLIDLFVWTFTMAMPRGKQNSTAPHCVPDLVHYAVRDRRPISYGAAFEQPVTTRGQGYTIPARQTLADYAATIDRLVGTRRRIAHGHATAAGHPIDHLGTCHPGFEDLATACAAAALNPAPRPTGDMA